MSKISNRWQTMFAENIRMERKRLGLDQAEFANLLGLKRASISVWETGSGLPTTEGLVKLCNVLDRTPNELICDYLDGSPPNEDKSPPNGSRKGSPVARSELSAAAAVQGESPPLLREVDIVSDVGKEREEIALLKQQISEQYVETMNRLNKL